MTYQDTVIDCLKTYPFIFPNRFAVDNHLFAATGNGYEWVNGQLININYLKNIDGKWEIFDFYTDKWHERVPADLINQYCDYSFEHYNYSIGSYSNKQICFINECSALANIPDDIYPDWLDAINDFIDYCISHQGYLMRESLISQLEVLTNTKEKIETIKRKNIDNENILRKKQRRHRWRIWD